MVGVFFLVLKINTLQLLHKKDCVKLCLLFVFSETIPIFVTSITTNTKNTKVMSKITENDAVFKAIESITGLKVVCYHTEANRYAFKSFAPLFGRHWHTLDMQIVDETAAYIK